MNQKRFVYCIYNIFFLFVNVLTVEFLILEFNDDMYC